MQLYKLDIMVVVERKEFPFGWTGYSGRSLVTLTEISKRKKVRGFITIECRLVGGGVQEVCW